MAYFFVKTHDKPGADLDGLDMKFITGELQMPEGWQYYVSKSEPVGYSIIEAKNLEEVQALLAPYKDYYEIVELAEIISFEKLLSYKKKRLKSAADN
ncbi:hypothetical protein [Zhaonella formicivorans]|uniref:hypothetical protein n=1 Tax=Zhaonella formicivorans TaxID=2528593 RepID=UPI0010F1A87C|nr:hypothetical protein [Zhaonella formicivorans]